MKWGRGGRRVGSGRGGWAGGEARNGNERGNDEVITSGYGGECGGSVIQGRGTGAGLSLKGLDVANDVEYVRWG